MLRFLARRLISGLLVLLAITFVAFLTQDVALRSRSNQPAPVGQVLQEAARDAVTLWRRLPTGDLGHYTTPTGAWRSDRAQPLSDLLPALLLRSGALLMLAMLLGGVVGGLIGLLAAASRRRGVSLALILLSIVGISTPSFFLGMLLQILEIRFYRLTGVQLLPVGGFGWDSHLVMPVLVLTARPLAQVARLTYVQVTQVLEQDYVRTAHSKGLKPRIVWTTHIIRNVATTVLTAMGTSLRYSLSSLPVVEVLFGWPGAGKAMLDMLRTFQRFGATTMVLAMGSLFVLINILMDLLYRVIDPRLREDETRQRTDVTWWEWVAGLLGDALGMLTLRPLRARLKRAHAPQPAEPRRQAEPETPAEQQKRRALQHAARWRAWRQATVGNPALILGAVIGCGLLVMVIAGPSLARHNAYSPSLFIIVDGQPMRPPVAPSTTYPLGTDAQGRDVLSLLLVGARRTLTMAFFAVMARLLIGGLLGFLAGWFAHTRLDRTISGITETLSAFPALLLAMLVVYAVGVQQGMMAFVIALALIGWGEVMQTVRAEVMRIKPMEYIESAVATGLGPGQMLTAHVLPNVWPVMVSLAFLEMGGVLMMLGELGFLGVFIGGGLGADGESGLPSVTYYDLPEWSVMLANSWRSFRSYPWATLYPGLAFFVSILGFTFLGEGLRWLAEKLTLSFRGLFNRYTLLAASVALVGVTWMFDATSAQSAFLPQAQTFSAERAVENIRHLSDEAFEGRRNGSPGADAAADWIADQFAALGLQPAGDTADGYFQHQTDSFRVLSAVPSLRLTSPDGTSFDLTYGADFLAHVGPQDAGGVGAGELVIISGATSAFWNEAQAVERFGITLPELRRADRVILQMAPDASENFGVMGYAGLMTLDDHGEIARGRYEMLARAERTTGLATPSVWLSPEVVQRIVSAAGASGDDLMAATREQRPVYLPTGWHAEIAVPAEPLQGVPIRHVAAFWPGKDMVLDSEMVIVAAHYDGLGRFPDGTLYPGANDNASGVATMLELIRTLKEQNYTPKRTLMFVAWTGREFHTSAYWTGFLRARLGFEEAYEVVAAIELEGVGAGAGKSAVLWRASSERLNEVLRKAARKVDTPLTTREAGLHADPALWSATAPRLPAATLSWAGSDELAHLPSDDITQIDAGKVGDVGRMVALALMVLASDPAY
jgi:ABC-type dipeptide/oligopeptide/nickel transport system permease subunit